MFAWFDEIPSMTLKDIKETVFTKAIKNYILREITPIVLAPSSSVFIISICLEDRNVFARFDEIPSMTL